LENLFVWILILAGAALALLGVFLVASERELKRKKQEIEKLTAQLDESPARTAPVPMALTQAVASDEVNDLDSNTERLHKEIADLSAKLELSRRAIQELENDGLQYQNAQAEAERLRAANDGLMSEIQELKERLHTSEARASTSVTENIDSAERQRELRTEIEDLQSQLTETRNKMRELEEDRKQHANQESLTANHAEERRQWEIKVTELETQVTEARQHLGDTESLRDRLAESERQIRILQEETQRYEQDIPRWQGRVAEAEENRHRLFGLRAPFDALLTQHAEISDRHKRFEEDLAEFSALMAMPASESRQANGTAAPTYHQTFAPPPPVNPVAAQRQYAGAEIFDEAHGEAPAATPQNLVAEESVNKKRKRRFGIFPVIVLLPIAGALAVGVLNKPAERDGTYPKTATAALTKPEQPLEELATTSAVERDAESRRAAIKAKESAKSPAKDVATATKAAARQTPKVAGIYEITQTSRVYTAPTELSQLIGDIEPGVKVNVVNTRDGWLEIHSKHGRPPGYIRKEAARIIAQN
jgi:hypothetical protein